MPEPTPAPRPAYKSAGQQAYPAEILDALRNRLVLHSQLKDRVMEWLGDPDKRQHIENGFYLVTLSIPTVKPADSPGQGSVGWPVEYLVRVTVFTKWDGAATGDQRRWNRDHWAMVAWVWNAVVGKMLYSEYDVPNPLGTPEWEPAFPIGRPLTTGLMRPAEGAVTKTNLVAGYGYSEWHVSVPSVMPLDRHSVV